MKVKIYLLLLLAIFYKNTNAQSLAKVEHIKIQSKSLQQEREILVATPIDYDWRVNEYFNVIYVFDSQDRAFFDYTNAMVSFLTDANKSYIIVGITSPYNKKLDYARNNDLLPVLETEKSKNKYGKYAGNAENFLAYVSEEVLPFVNSNYRTLKHSIAVGHSLSASFILSSLVKKPNLFRNYIAISPNLANDNEKLAKELINFDYKKINDFTYLYVSNANEGLKYWQEWKPAREKFYAFLNNQLNEAIITTKVAKFPQKNHYNTFPPSLDNALDHYFKNVSEKQHKELSKEEFAVKIKVKVPNENDTIYITGNQNNIGNWNPNKVTLKKVSKYEREISLKLKSPAIFKFTRGNWESEAEVIGTYRDITILPELKKEFVFEIEDYFDKY